MINDPLDDDLFNDTAPNPLKKLMSVIFISFLLIAVGAGVYYGLNRPNTAHNHGPLTVIHAESSPTKIKPDDPGGMVVPNMDKTVYDALSKPTQKDNLVPKVERVLPGPEEPVNLNGLLTPQEDPSAIAQSLPSQSDTPTAMEDRAAETIIKTSAETLTPDTSHASSSQQKGQQEAPKETQKEGIHESPLVIQTLSDQQDMAPSPAQPISIAKTNLFIQLAAFKNERDALAMWSKVNKKHARLLSGLQPVVVRKEFQDKGVFFRLQAGPTASEATARQLCQQLIDAGQGCFVTKSDRANP